VPFIPDQCGTKLAHEGGSTFDIDARYHTAVASKPAFTPAWFSQMLRLGTAQESAAAAIFLASEKASFMTGQIQGVNGGGVMNG
jgi:NAD(P)-dependent dehydrogenase (short-subunit alcohol dehydrogenase family)